MSIDSAKAYIERIKTDEKFRKKVLACTDAKKRMKLVKSEGFDFTAEEIKNEIASTPDDKLSQCVAGKYEKKHECGWSRYGYHPL